MNKSTATVSILLALAVGLLVGHSFWKSATVGQNALAGASPSGTTFSSSKDYYITVSPLTGTSTSLFNSDSNDRYITNASAFCSNASNSFNNGGVSGIASWLLKASTSTVNGAGTTTPLVNTNFAMLVPISTSTAFAYVATSTWTAGAYEQVWPTGTYLNFQFNATNTAACSVGVHTLAS